MSNWLQLLQKQIETKGQTAVASELGVSKTTISLIAAGKYQASPERIATRVLAMYGAGGRVDCPVLGLIEPKACAETQAKAVKIGMRAGSPQTLRLYKACLACEIRPTKAKRQHQ